MLSTPLIWASMGAATESASVFESAPGYVAVTVTCTGVIVGYCSTGRASMATTPARPRMIETTAAKIGRSMKNLDMALHPGLDDDGHAGVESHRAVDDHLVSVVEAFRDEPVALLPPADLDGPRLGPPLLVDHPHEVPLRALLHGPLGDDDRVRPDGPD